jgi:hypothetical protein
MPSLYDKLQTQLAGRIMRTLRFLHVLFAACFTAGAIKSNAGTLIDVAFTSALVTSKTGFAATAVTSNDFWKTSTPTVYQGNYLTGGAVPNLKFVNGTASGAGLGVIYSGPDGAYNNGATDPMYGTYLYVIGDFGLAINSLVAGVYDVYLYGQFSRDRPGGCPAFHNSPR